MSCLAGVQGVDRVDCRDVKTSFPWHGNNTSKLSWLAQIHQNHHALLWDRSWVWPLPFPEWIFKDTILIRWINIGWGARHWEDALSGFRSQHKSLPAQKVTEDDILSEGESRVYEVSSFWWKLSFLARTSQPHLLPFRQVISQPPNPPHPKILSLLDNTTKNDSKQGKFSNFPPP